MKVHLILEVDTGDEPAVGAIEIACNALRYAHYRVTAGSWHEVDEEPFHADH